MATARERLKAFIRRLGYRIHRDPFAGILARRGVSVVLDVGANEGQFASELRGLGFKGKIISFEPMAEARRTLTQLAEADPAWDIVHFGLGDFDGSSILNVSENSASSSILEMLPAHLTAAPQSRYVRTETIEIRRLDGIFDDYCKPDDIVLMKLDTQGFEHKILLGADAILRRLDGIQMELSLVPLYESEHLIEDLIAYLRSRRFIPVDIDPFFRNLSSLELVQCEMLFLRSREEAPGSDLQ